MRKLLSIFLIKIARKVYMGKCAECGNSIMADSRTNMCNYCYYG